MFLSTPNSPDGVFIRRAKKYRIMSHDTRNIHPSHSQTGTEQDLSHIMVRNNINSDDYGIYLA